MDDRVLLDSADAFGDQISDHRNELFAHCYRMMGTVDEAEDALQEAFTRGWAGRDTFRRSISFRAWLFRIATNVCLNAIDSRSSTIACTRSSIRGRVGNGRSTITTPCSSRRHAGRGSRTRLGPNAEDLAPAA